MRIISGRYRGLRISAPKNIRPTQDKVREAVFNVIAGRTKGARVLDLFAGSGAFGIEALSRGADYALFVDDSRISTRAVEKNLERLKPEDIEKAGVITKDAQAAIRLLHKRGERFDIIFLDPPYYKNWVRKCLKNINLHDILADSGLIIAEHSKKDAVPMRFEAFESVRQLTYGDTIISIFTKS